MNKSVLNTISTAVADTLKTRVGRKSGGTNIGKKVRDMKSKIIASFSF